MARRYHLDPLPDAGRVALPAAVAHHLIRVLRTAIGDPVVLFDGRGRECDARVLTVAGAGHRLAVEVQVDAARDSTREPGVRIEVAFPPPKGNRDEWVFEHATEIGVAAFRPIHTARATPRDRRHRAERWQRILVAATGQCDRGCIPRLHDAVDFTAMLADPSLPAERYLASASSSYGCGDAPRRDGLRRETPRLGRAQSAAAILLVGPEGGFTEAEIAQAESAGFVRRSLGSTTLRTETAVVAGAVLLLQGL